MRQISISGLNTGVLNTVSAGQDISDISNLVVNIVQATGNIAGAVITIEKSVDNATWVSTGVTIAAAALSAEVVISTQWVRLKVTTASGAASTANCIIQGKDGYFPFLLSAAVSSRADIKSILRELSEINTKLSVIASFQFSLDKSQKRSINDQ